MRTVRSLCGGLLLGTAQLLHAETKSYPEAFAQIPELTLNMPSGTTAVTLPDAVGNAYGAAANRRAWRTETRATRDDYLQLDPTPGNAYDGEAPSTLVTYALSDAQGTRQSWFAAVEAQHSAGAQVQLLVGIDANGDSLPQAGEEVCRIGEEAYDNQRCLLDLRGNTGHALWAFARIIGPIGTSYTPIDQVSVSIATADFQIGDHGTTVSVVPGSDFLFAPGNDSKRGDFSYRPDVAHAGSDPFGAVGGLLLTAADDALSTATVWPLRVEFTPVVRAGESYAFASRGYSFDDVKVLLAPGEAYYGLYADDTYHGALELVVLNPDASVFVWHEPFPAASADSRFAQTVPPGDTVGFNLWPGSLPGASTHAWVPYQFAPGNSRIRFRVRNETSFAIEARVRMRLIRGFELDPPPPLGLYAASGNYYNPLRSGDGIFLDLYNELQIFYWYTFDRNGQPIWYVASAQATYEEYPLGNMHATLYRIDRLADGTRKPTPVGRIVLTQASNNGTDLMFSWRIDGDSGANRIRLATTPRCTQQAPGQKFNPTGHWFDLGAPGWGTNLLGLHDVIAEGLYFFDAQGAPRWVFGNLSFGNNAWSGAMYQFKGACPTCSYVAPTLTPAGSGTVILNSDSEARATYSINLVAPLLGSFAQTSAPIHRATDAVPCVD